MKTTESNKLIAEFMELEIQKMYFNFMKGNYVKKIGVSTEIDPVKRYIYNGKPVADLKYHSSWDWLMPVVEKIESLGRTTVVFEQDNLVIITTLLHEIGQPFKCKQFSNKSIIKIEAVYNAVHEFILWYNKQKTAS